MLPTVTVDNKEIGVNLRVALVVYEYLHTSGTFDDLPKIRSWIDTPEGRLTITKVEPLCKFLDSGKTPFTVRLHCAY